MTRPFQRLSDEGVSQKSSRDRGRDLRARSPGSHLYCKIVHTTCRRLRNSHQSFIPLYAA